MTDDSKNAINIIAESIKIWLISGDIDTNILSVDFIFESPFWKRATRSEFTNQFSDPTTYKDTALSKIKKFDPVVITISDDKQCFNIFLTYHTLNGCSVNECVFGRVLNGKLVNLISVYDLEETKRALAL